MTMHPDPFSDSEQHASLERDREILRKALIVNHAMKWYWQRAGGHTHVRVFMNGAQCGNLCFRNEEFDWIREPLQQACMGVVEFIESHTLI